MSLIAPAGSSYSPFVNLLTQNNQNAGSETTSTETTATTTAESTGPSTNADQTNAASNGSSGGPSGTEGGVSVGESAGGQGSGTSVDASPLRPDFGSSQAAEKRETNAADERSRAIALQERERATSLADLLKDMDSGKSNAASSEARSFVSSLANLYGPAAGNSGVALDTVV